MSFGVDHAYEFEKGAVVRRLPGRAARRKGKNAIDVR